jgi:hypothetical protein
VGTSAGEAGAFLADGLVHLPEDGERVERWLEAQAHGAEGGPPYQTDGVFALWPARRAETDRWTFGLEFEFADADAGWVASELYALGLCASPRPAAYHSPRPHGRWVVEQDRSVSAVFNSADGTAEVVVGGEVVSPPLRDTAAAWEQVAVVLDVLRRCGARVSQQCGLHVHVGTDALRGAGAGRRWDHGLPAPEDDLRRGALLPVLSRLAMLASVCFEDLVFRMASAEGGRHRGQAFFYRHCRPLERPLQPVYESVSELAEALGKAGAARRAALNLTNVGDPAKDTVEFRQCNGTLDGRVVQAFCRLCAALVGGARWYPDAARLPAEPLGTHWRHAGGDRSPEPERPDPLWRFLGAVCPDGLPLAAAGSLLWLFRRGSWQPSLAALASG